MKTQEHLVPSSGFVDGSHNENNEFERQVETMYSYRSNNFPISSAECYVMDEERRLFVIEVQEDKAMPRRECARERVKSLYGT